MIQTDAKLEQWRKNYRRRDRLQSHKRKADDRLMLIDKNQVATYDASAHKQQTCKLFDDFLNDPNKKLTRTDYCSMRDHLLVEIGLSNAQRSGVVVNMTMEEYKGNSTIGNQHHIPVWNHKAVETYGPEPLLLKQDYSSKT